MSANLDSFLATLPQENYPLVLSPINKTGKYEGKTYYYDAQRKVNNLYYRFMPAGIAMCFKTEHVVAVMKGLPAFKGPVRVCSGKHDHEGESMGTDALVIDLSAMSYVTVCNFKGDEKDEKGYALISPGIKFIDLIKELNQNGVSIPHGTCHSVRIAGYSFGGGWGPWTRAKGMGCETLAGATIVLGDGTVKNLWDNTLIPEKLNGEKPKDMSEDDKALLWALRGGGGMSYGIVTELVYKTFKLPPYTTKFIVAWKSGYALKILKKWEEIISGNNHPDLLGTNLKIEAKPEIDADINKARHACTFYGYYQSQDTQHPQEAIRSVITKWFQDDDYGSYDLSFLDSLPKNNADSPEKANWSEFAAWDRVIHWEDKELKNPIKGLKNYQLIPPEVDGPAPHKITSRIVRADNAGGGLGIEGRKNLIRSLQSTLLSKQGFDAGLSCYVTLGAISGPYYYAHGEKAEKAAKEEIAQRQLSEEEATAALEKKMEQVNSLHSAFPYKNRPYTIQYQVWWDQKPDNSIVDFYVNKALDWQQECRNLDFPQTKGSFISFKDAEIPTSAYFQENYQALQSIKQKYAKDPLNRLSSRKTII